MSLHTIQKQFLLGELFSNDALQLAKAIYNTYIKDDKNLYMEIEISKIETLLKLDHSKFSLQHIIYTFEEINEPIGVRHFKYFAKEYPIRFLVFCTYEIVDDLIIIYLNEEFLYAEDKYMIDKFLTS